MRAFSIFATVTLVAFASTPSAAQAPCGTWDELPTLGLQADNPQLLAAAYLSATQDLFVAGTCFCGTATFGGPRIYRRVGGSWVSVTTSIPFTFGDTAFMDLIDTGAGPEVYAWGDWATSPGSSAIFRWNGTDFVPVLPAIPPYPTDVVAFDDGTGLSLYAAATHGVYHLFGGAWVQIATAQLDTVSTLAVFDDGNGSALYAGGSFTTIAGVPCAGIARWTGSTWTAVGAGIAGAVAQNYLGIADLYATREESGPVLYAAGGFQTMDGQPSKSLARFDGTSWTGMGQSFPALQSIFAQVKSFDDGTGAGASIVAIRVAATTTGVWKLTAGTWSDLGSVLAPNHFFRGRLCVADLPETSGLDLVVPAGMNGSTATTYAVQRLEACGQTGRITCVGDGSIAACPCGNTSNPSARVGCASSLGSGGALRANGFARLGADTLRLDGSGMNDGPLLYFQGSNEIAPLAYGDGLLCTIGSLVRLRVTFNNAGASSIPLFGDADLSIQGFVASPGTRYYQARYRDSLNFCTSDTFNTTNGVAIVWAP